MPRIDEIWVFISEDAPGEEGIIGAKLGENWVPFVAADRERVESLKPIAREIGKITERKVKLVKFSNRTDVETIGE